jgi:hypothetical protein
VYIAPSLGNTAAAAATNLAPSAEQATESHTLLGAVVCTQLAPESDERKIPPLPGCSIPGLGIDAATSFVPSAEQASEDQ